MSKKIRLTRALRDALKERAATLVAPVHEAAVVAAGDRLLEVTAKAMDDALPPAERAVLEKLQCLGRPSYLVVAAGLGTYRGLERDVFQWTHEGEGSFTDRAVFRLDLRERSLVEWPSITLVPVSMLCEIIIRDDFYLRRRSSLILYTRVGSTSSMAAVAVEDAVKAYEAERQARLDIYTRLIEGTKYFEDLLEFWPEVKDLYQAHVATQRPLLPATLSASDRLLLEQDMEERRRGAS